jgi:hypothetical protein
LLDALDETDDVALAVAAAEHAISLQPLPPQGPPLDPAAGAAAIAVIDKELTALKTEPDIAIAMQNVDEMDIQMSTAMNPPNIIIDEQKGP